MKRRTSKDPVRVYAYGCLAPIENKELFSEQIHLAHKFKNKLIEIERQRRVRIQEAQRTQPDLGPLHATIAALEARLETERQALKDKRAGAGRKAKTDAERGTVKATVQELRDTRARLKTARVAARTDKALIAAYKAADAEAVAALKVASAASGVHWGTKGIIYKSLDQWRKLPAPPDFVRWDGEGQVGIQLISGISVEELYSCEDTRVQIAMVGPIPADLYQRKRHQRRLASRMTVKIRVGSEGKRRTPVWATLPVIMHRPLPSDAKITWAAVHRRRVGLRYEYRLLLTLEAASLAPPAVSPGHGRVAIDIGWRWLPDERIRVGYWRDDTGANGQFFAPERTRIGLRKTEDLRSIRDKMFDEIKPQLAGWIKRTSTPEWFTEKTKFLAQWRSTARLGGLVSRWGKERFAGDEEIFPVLAAWAKQDRHLLAWEAQQRDRRIGHRRNEYRVLAARLASTYSTILIRDYDVAETTKGPEPEEGLPSDDRDQRYRARVASPGELREAIVQAATSRGVQVIKMSAPYKCHACGVEEEWDRRQFIEHTCGQCGVTWDQDDNACRLMLASAEVPPPGGEVLADGEDSEATEPRAGRRVETSARSITDRDRRKQILSQLEGCSKTTM